MGEIAAGIQSEAVPKTSTWRNWRELMSPVWVITRREIRDTMRDWRLVVPITLLTLVFPVLLNFAAIMMLRWVQQYRANVVGEQAIPFMLLVVGFFPISFSLVIALETFVGEKERKSLEPLLATPLSNTQLYLGKTLAALIPPVAASYLGIAVYLVSLVFSADYRPPTVVVIQLLLLTFAEALVMVSGAVIVSSQTTSVRAANLLASFIILPMAFLIQGEAIIMFWRRYETLWFVLLGLIVTNIMLVRMGVRIFNREELLGREIDNVNLRRSWRLFKGYLLNSPSPESVETKKRGIWGVYRYDVPRLLRFSRAPLVVVLIGLLGAIIIGWGFAAAYPLPPGLLDLSGIGQETFDQFDGSRFLPSLSVSAIFGNNVRSLLLGTFLGIFSFGALAILLLMAPVAIIAFLTVQAALAGYNPLVFLGAFVLPHGIVEMPAAIIATAAAVRLGMSVVAPPRHMTVSQSWLQALAHFIKLFVLVVLPALLIAAAIEVYITPRIVIAIYGG